MNTTKKLAEELGCTPQAINKAIRKACEAESIDPRTFGEPDPKDKRIRIFSHAEIELILKYAPTPKANSKPVSETVSETLAPVVEKITPVTPAGLVVKTAQPIMAFNIQTLNVNVVVGSTQVLDQKTDELHQLTASAFNTLKQITKDELQSDISQMRAQNKHAVAGIQASATVEVVQSMVNQQRQDVVQPQPHQVTQECL